MRRTVEHLKPEELAMREVEQEPHRVRTDAHLGEGQMVKINPRWKPDMMRRSGHAAQQVRCLTGDQESQWIHGLDDLPAPVRRRLAESIHNICPTCVNMEARAVAAAHGLSAAQPQHLFRRDREYRASARRNK